MKGYLTLSITLGEKENAKKIKVKYIFIDAFPHIIWLVTLFTLYLCMKYPLSNGRVGVVRGDQKIAMKCYT